LRMILGRALLLMATGLAIGLFGAWTLAGSVGTFLFDVRPHDPVVYIGVGLLLMTAGLLAAFVPARRAARVDPMIALRAD
jgi:ABC-type antimicrobial peptide transport system permease subunit